MRNTNARAREERKKVFCFFVLCIFHKYFAIPARFFVTALYLLEGEKVIKWTCKQKQGD